MNLLCAWFHIACSVSAPPPPVTVIPTPVNLPSSLSAVASAAAASSCAARAWNGRGTAPTAYMQGMAMSFGKSYCKLKSGDAAMKLASEPNTGDDTHDAISWYNSNYRGLGMVNGGGIDTLRHLFVLAISHGMQESSGKYCTGHDNSAGTETSTEAEAGLFQTSANASSSSPLLAGIYGYYQANPSKCLLDVFSRGVTCSAGNWANVGSGQGAQFQALMKSCPAAAVEVDLVTLRVLKNHYGPIIRKAAELYGPCDDMLSKVQASVDAGNLCASLL